MHLHEYATYDAFGLAELIRRREVTSEEMIALARHGMETANPLLNFLVAPIGDGERGPCDQDGPFTGVPFLLKDLGTYLAGVPCECGSALAKGVTLDHDTVLAQRYRRAGLVPIGRTVTPEFGVSHITATRAGGPTRNPWDLSRSPGGSSGGSAAAVAAGVVPMAHAADGMGSIRIPAHCCGLFGLKPSRGRIPTGPGWSGLGELSVNHVLTRSVRDSAAMLDATAGPEPGGGLPLPAGTFLDAARRDPAPLRIGVLSRLPFGGEIDPDCAEALRQTAGLATDLGHRVEQVDFPLDAEAFLESLLAVAASNLAYGIGRLETLTKRRAGPNTLEATSLACLRHAESLTVKQVLAALDRLNGFARQMGLLFQSIDILLAPVCRAPALSVDGGSDSAGKSAHDILSNALDYVQLSPLFNATGQPAMSLPGHWTASGLPVGVQCVADHGADAVLLGFAGQIERAHPWNHRRPPAAAGV